MGIHDGHREKMRRRFQETGLEGFADHEALELLLYYAIPRRDTNELAHRLLARYGSLAALLQAPVEDLRRTEGIGESAAVFLKLVPAFVYKAQRSAGQETILNSTEKAGRYLLTRFAGERNEVIYQLCLDRKGKLLACKRLSEGGGAEHPPSGGKRPPYLRQRRHPLPQPPQRHRPPLPGGLRHHPAGPGRPAHHRRGAAGPHHRGGGRLRLPGGQRHPPALRKGGFGTNV